MSELVVWFNVATLDVSVGMQGLGQWINSMKIQGRPTKLPAISKREDTVLKSQLMMMVSEMICPEAKDRVSSQHVCVMLNIISGNV